MTYHGSKANIPIALVATKIDLLKNDFSGLEEASKIAQEKGWLFHKTSAKENIGINELFESLIRKFLDLPMPVPTGSNIGRRLLLEKSPSQKQDYRFSIAKPKYQSGSRPSSQEVLPDTSAKQNAAAKSEKGGVTSKKAEPQEEGGLISRFLAKCC